ncbi:MAG: hypothetical protein F4Y01_12525 [Gammaproteobacteria bacterium]|nr:hypothetical protein [Gammaproteobacteria bacterium]
MDQAEQTTGMFGSVRFWQGWSIAATIGALFAVVASFDFSDPAPGPDYVAIVGALDAEPLWVIGANLEEGVVTARAVTARATGDTAYRLWLVRGKGEPLAIGTLPVNSAQASIPISDTIATLLGHGRTIGVSRGSAAEDADAESVSFEHRANLTRV